MNKITSEISHILDALKEAMPTIKKQISERRTGGLLDDRRLLKLVDAYEDYIKTNNK